MHAGGRVKCMLVEGLSACWWKGYVHAGERVKCLMVEGLSVCWWKG